MISELQAVLDELLSLARPEHPDTGWSKDPTFLLADTRTSAGIELQTGLFLLGLVARFQPRLVVEIGSYRGFSGSYMLAGMETYGGGRFHSFDIVDRPKIWDQIPMLKNRRTTVTYVNKPIWEVGPPGDIDMCFLDSDHTETATRRELEILKPLVRPGGLLVMHDTSLTEAGKVSRQWLTAESEKDWSFIDLYNARGLTLAQKKFSGLTPEGQYKELTQ